MTLPDAVEALLARRIASLVQTIICVQCGEQRRIGGYSGVDLVLAQMKLYRLGWRRAPGPPPLDYCPRHAGTVGG